ncbi:MAG: hypothetical protein H6Q73_3882 [Firmicutes bacterium]|nr:hypothetical protein [Bacillota bacterium]
MIVVRVFDDGNYSVAKVSLEAIGVIEAGRGWEIITASGRRNQRLVNMKPIDIPKITPAAIWKSLWARVSARDQDMAAAHRYQNQVKRGNIRVRTKAMAKLWVACPLGKPPVVPVGRSVQGGRSMSFIA